MSTTVIVKAAGRAITPSRGPSLAEVVTWGVAVIPAGVLVTQARVPGPVAALAVAVAILAASLAIRRGRSCVEPASRARLANGHLESRELIDCLPSLVVGLDQRGRIALWNRAAEKLFGLPRQRMLGEFFHNAGLPLEWDRLVDYRPETDGTHAGVRLEDLTITRPDGTTAYLGITVLWLPTPVAGEVRLLLLGADVTERRQFEAMTLQNLKLESIGQLASGIAHEINTPIQFIGDNLSFIETFVTHLCGGAGAELLDRIIAGGATAEDLALLNLDYHRAEIPRAISQSHEGIERVSKIVQAMKTFARPDAEQPVPSDLNRCIANAVTISQGQCKQSASIVMDLDPDVGQVICHPGEIGQVVLNLLINAAHAIEEGIQATSVRGLITVASRRKGSVVEIRVTDSGTGIPERIKSRIFDPFFTTKPVGKGTGQGLYIVRRIVERGHRGSIRFVTNPGKGTTFIVSLPVDPGSHALSPQASAGSRTLRESPGSPPRAPGSTEI